VMQMVITTLVVFVVLLFALYFIFAK